MNAKCKWNSNCILSKICFCVVVCCRCELSAELVDFEAWPLAPESSWIGPVPEDEGVEQEGPFGGTVRQGAIEIGGLRLVNRRNLSFGDWSGFAVSNETDTTTSGAANLTSAITGGGANQSRTYAVAFGYVDNLDPTQFEQLSVLPAMNVADGLVFSSLLVTNTTYASSSMREGDRFAKKFGGASGSDPDFFRLSIYGVDANGVLLDHVVETFLADYRFADHADDYIVDDWQLVDLKALATARTLYFNLDSTDSNQSGLTTPAFFAVDNVVLASSAVGDFEVGDFDKDGLLSSTDADLLCDRIHARDASAEALFFFDLNGDLLLSLSDLDSLLLAARTRAGDTNLDGKVAFDDFLTLSGKFGHAGTWSDGNFDCNDVVGFSDFLALSRNFGTLSSRTITIPEAVVPGYLRLLILIVGIQLSRRGASRGDRSPSGGNPYNRRDPSSVCAFRMLTSGIYRRTRIA